MVRGSRGCLDSTSSGPSPSPEPTGVTPKPPDEPRTDDLYLHNEDGEAHRVSIRLVRVDGEADETVLANVYRLPGAFRLHIPDVGDRGAIYEISAALDGEHAGTWTWDVRTCEGTEAPRGNRDGEVRIEDGEADLSKNACDAIAVESRPASDHAAYLVEGPETTRGTKTTTGCGRLSTCFQLLHPRRKCQDGRK